MSLKGDHELEIASSHIVIDVHKLPFYKPDSIQWSRDIDFTRGVLDNSKWRQESTEWSSFVIVHFFFVPTLPNKGLQFV